MKTVNLGMKDFSASELFSRNSENGLSSKVAPSEKGSILHRFGFLLVMAIFMLTSVSGFAEANYVYHERTNANPGCGPNYVNELTPTSTEAVALAWKVEYQFYTTNSVVYYTTDGSTPTGAFGVGTGTTQVVAGSFNCTFGGPAVDVVTATIPAQPNGTVVKYIISAWHSGGGAEIFANGPGTPCSGCGPLTDDDSEATVFQYSVYNVLNVNTGEFFTSLQAAIDDANTVAGHEIQLLEDISEALVTVSKAVIIDGTGNTLNSTSAIWGINPTVANVTIENLILQDAGTFGIQTGCDAHNLVLSNVTVNSCGGTGISIYGSDNCTLTNVTSTNNAGNGLNITNSNNTTISGITTSGNAFAGGFNAGIGIFTSNTFCLPAGVNGLSLSGANIAEQTKVYSQKALATDIITGLTGTDLAWAVGIGALDRNYWPSKATAYAVVDALFEAPFNYPNTLLYVVDVTNENYYVNDDPNGDTSPAMLIQTAINFQAAGNTIFVESGTYSEQVLVNKSVSIFGSGATQPLLDFTGTVTGKPTIFDVSADNVVIDNLHFNVNLATLRSAIIATSAGLDNITITDNVIDAYGTPAGSYGDRNAVSVNYGGTTNYRVASGGVNNITFTGNTINGTGPSSYFRSAISTDEAAGTFSNNISTTINHDVLVRFANNGAITVSNNTFSGGGAEFSDFNASASPVTISNNTFTSAGAPGTAVLRIKNNYHAIAHSVSGNTFTGHDWAISIENAGNISIDNNDFNTGLATAHALVFNTKSISSNSNSIVQVPLSASITNNNFNGAGNAITFQNHDSDNDSYGTFVLGTASNENTFAATLSTFIVLDSQTGSSATSTFPTYPGTGGWLTTMACFGTDLNAVNNTFDVGSGQQLPSAMNLAAITALEAKLQHKPDNACLSSITYAFPVHNLTQATDYTTIQAAINAANAGDVIQCDEFVYNERVVIDRSITLQGVNEANVRISGTGLVGTGKGIQINNGVTNVTIKDLTVENFAGSSGNADAGIYAIGGNNNLNVNHVTIRNNVGGSGFYANGPVNNVTLNFVTSHGHTIGARGIVIWNGAKDNITITNCHVYGNNCCGIELQDGTASGVNMSNNNVHNNGDSGMSAIGLNETVGPNVISNNTITENGRFGMEIKLPNGGVTISNNTVSRTLATDARDGAGIAIFRRGYQTGLGYVDIPNGVTVTGNNVSGYVQPSTSEGFGIVIEGTGHTVSGNTVSNCDVAIQQQAGHLPYNADASGDGDQSNLADQFFGRGNTPYTCGNDISSNTYSSNGVDERNVGSVGGASTVINTNTGEVFCTIQGAIDDNQTLNGHTIEVEAGTYAENIIVDKSLTILGPNAGVNPCSGTRGAEAIVVPSAAEISFGEIFHVAASNVTIDGFTIDGDNTSITSGFTSTTSADIDAAEGVTVYETGVNNLNVSNNIIQNLSYFGVTLYDYPAGVPSSGHVINNNKIQNLGTYDAGSGIDFWGGAVLLYNNQYASVTNNCMTNVRLGLQTGNFYAANPGAAASIANNTISARRRGIFHNLAYSSASAFTLTGNTITGLANANETAVWDGILLSSLSVPSTASSNTISANALTIPTTGISVWNCQTAPLISGGSISNVGLGINVNNFEGYPTSGSNANNTTATIDDATISNTSIAAIKVHDNPSNTNGATVNAEIRNNVDVSNSPIGIWVVGSDATANIHDNASTITGNVVGIDVNGGNATIYRNTVSANGTGIRSSNGGILTSVTENFITNNTGDGISIEATAGATGNINNNDLSGNSGLAINDASGATIDATCNWYGAADAATADAEVNGAAVDYISWLSSGTDASGDAGFQAEAGACEGTEIVLTETHVDVDCFGASTGSIDLTIAGGVAPYDILWSNTSTSEDLTNISAGSYTVTVTDDLGSVATLTISISEPTAVVASAVQDVTLVCPEGNVVVTVSAVGGTPSYTGTGTFTVGEGTYDYLVSDANGCEDAVSITISSTDTEAPEVLCQNITVNLDEDGIATIVGSDVDGGTTDNCEFTLSVSPSTFNCDDVDGDDAADLFISEYIEGSSNNKALEIFNGTGAPVNLSNYSIRVYFNGSLTPSLTLPLSGTLADNGVYVVAHSAANASILAEADATIGTLAFNGNDAIELFKVSASQRVDVFGRIGEDPGTAWSSGAFTTADRTLYRNPSVKGGVTTNPAAGFPTLSSEWTQLSVNNSSNLGGHSMNADNDVVLTATDASGNVSTCIAAVSVVDDVAPDAICEDIEVELSVTGEAVIIASQVDGGSTDACGIFDLEIDISEFTCAEVGSANIVELTVTDVNGNQSTCESTVTVLDVTAPVAICQNVTVQLDASGNASILATQIDNGSNDACGIASLSVSPDTFTCSNVGPNTVTLTVVDTNGNSSTCTATVTVQDNVAPIAACQNITVQLDEDGLATITAASVNNGSSDACGIQSIAVSQTNFDCSHVGANNVVLTVTDANGNVATCTAVVTVEDNVAPTASCNDLTVQLGASGVVTITADDIDNGSFDACGISSITVSQTSFDCTNVGNNPVLLTVTDIHGNVSTCPANVIVQDVTNPTAICQDITVNLDASGLASIMASQINNGSSDACGIASLSISQSSFDCTDIGSNAVVLTVTDVNGNSSQCTANVTVVDNVAPIAICRDITVSLGADGTASILASQIDNGSSDACGIDTYSVSTSTFTCANIGLNPVVLTVTDVNGNVSTCNAIVNVIDDLNPTAICQNITVQLGVTGSVSITASQIDNGSSDNCGIASISVSPNSFTCSEVGINTVTLTVVDVNGNSSTCTATVTVEDIISPTITCPADISVSNDAGVCGATVTYVVNYGDNCSGAILSQTAGLPSGSVFPVGTTVNTFLVTDASGNSATCSFEVVVADTEAPVASCQSITIALDNTGNASISSDDINFGSTDNCGIASYSLSQNTFTCDNVGINVIELAVIDIHGNISTCPANVTVLDNIAPNAICQDIVVSLGPDGTVTITPAQINDGSNDACGISSLSAFPLEFGCTNAGPNTVVLTVTDVNGNVSTCSATVTVVDDQDPIIECPADVTVNANSGSCFATGVNLGIPTLVNDNCEVDIISNNGLSSYPVGQTIVTWTATDDSGNLGTCEQIVTVLDIEAPVAICHPITVQLNAGGNASIDAEDVDAGSFDACGIASLSVSPNTFDCSNVGPNTVTLTVVDLSGNVSTCSAIVTVQDLVAPVASCQNITVQLDGSGSASIVAADVNFGSTDACGIASMSVSPNTFNCSNVGANAVTLTVTDVNGNVSTCSSTVTVQDNVAPLAICQNVTVMLDASGNASITASQVNNGSSDACGIATTSVVPSAFTCANVGLNTVTLTVTDVNGNSSQCTANVTVVDNVAPVAVCQNHTVQLDATGNASILASQVDGGSSDACGIASLSVSPSSFTCANVGLNTVTLTVTDVNGNVSTCNAIVTVQDLIAPIAVCQPITVQLDANGNASILASEVDGGSSDACGISTLSVSPSNFTCANVGSNTVTLTVTDVNGNVSTCSTTVTIEDNVAPIANCQDINVDLGPSGVAIITAAEVNNGSSDACGIASISVSPSSFTCSNVGPNPVTLTVTDVNGNVSTCSAVVTVVDITAPTAICHPLTIQLDASGNASIVAAEVDGGSSDACGIASLSVSPSSFTCANVGSNTVTLTVTDVNGNVSTCTTTVTVQDNVAPIALCQATTVQLDANGNASIVAADVDGGSSDACGISSLSVSPSSFTCANVGSNTVTLTVTDVNGNVSTCTTTVTVEDNVAPIAVCQPLTVQLDATGNASILASEVNDGSSDACGIASLSVSPSSFTCANVGSNTITLTVTDVNGNVSTCSTTVTVQDNVAPIALCQAITVQLDADGNASIVAADVDGGSNDACGIASLSVSPSSFTCANVGSNTVTLTVTDVNGNVSTCTTTVTVEDSVAPIALCQATTVQLDANGNASIVAADVDGGSSDACGISSLSVSPSSFTCANVGSNTVTLTVTDVNGNVSTCTTTVTVEDNVAPIAVCQPLTVQLDATGNASILASEVNDGSSDACGIASLSVSPSSFTCANVGSNTVTLTVTDVNGNVSTCSTTVTVQDNVAPIALCQAITVQLDADGNASIVAADVDGGSNDACGIASLSVSPSSFTCANVGSNTVTLTVTDVNGNVSTCTTTVTVEDNVAPIAVCQPLTVQLDATGNASILASEVNDGSSDACGIASLSVSPSSFTCANVGSNTVTLTVTDVNGNVSTCSTTVTVQDNVAPIAVCQPLTVQLDATGNASILASEVNDGSSDACGIASLSVSPSSFTCANVGSNTVTLTVTDVNGNVSTCSTTVTVQDNVAPIALCQAITVQLDADGNASIVAADVDGGSNDACGIASLSVSPSSFTCANVGSNTVTLTVTDVNGNVSTCTTTVTVEDNVAPIALCQATTVQLDADGNASIVAADVDGGSSDACGIASLSVSPSSFTCANVGSNTVTLTVTDVNGNVSTCTTTVTVEDNVAPIAICQDLTVALDASGNATILASQINNGSSDACGIQFITVAPNAFTCANVGANTVTLTVTDVNGNVSTCSATVTVTTVYGCTNPLAVNYNPAAICNDGSCSFDGCTYPLADNYNPLALVDDGSCIFSGCTDPAASNYCGVANFDDGSCIYDVLGCTYPDASNYNSLATVDDGSCVYEGCTDNAALNYNPLATIDNGSCVYAVPGCTNVLASNYNVLATVDDGSCQYNGCTDAAALNYNPYATNNDGSCTYAVPGCTNALAANYNPLATVDNGSCQFNGCTDVAALNYNPYANFNDGTCTYAVPGCTNADAFNYNSLATVDDGSCVYNGCTDLAADNYNPCATVDDGSCTYPVLGCTYPDALNFNPLATDDDGSCIIESTGCEGDFNNDGVIGVSDLLSFIAVYGTTCP